MKSFRLLLPLVLLSTVTGLTGCTLATTEAPGPVTGNSLAGVAFGGQQPIAGAKVYLLAANPAAYGSASLSLLTAAGTGNAVDTIGSYGTTAPVTGKFALAGEYDCTKGYALGASTSGTPTTLPGSEQVYLYVLGGNPGSGINSNVGLLAALGPCNAPYATTLVVNEITTAAAAYALAGFASDATHIASSGTSLALTGLTNAGLNSANLVSISTGLPVASDTATTRPVATLYTLADMLAACVNGTTGNGNCTTLFQYTESTGATGTPASDTATATINLAHNPWPTAAGMTALWGLVPSTGAPFTGGLSAQPIDFTLGLTYSGGGLSSPESLAIDAFGNAWAANVGTNSLSKTSSTGTAISPSSGYMGGGFGVGSPNSIAIDPLGNVWTVNYGTNNLSKFSSSGQAVSTSAGYTGGGLNNPVSIAIDGSGNVWAASDGNYVVSKFSNAGMAISSSSGYSGGGIYFPEGIAIDGSGDAWVTDPYGNALSEFSSTGGPLSPANTGDTGGGLNHPYSLAIDASGNVWAANLGGNSSISKFSNGGGASSGTSGYVGGGINQPYGIAIDGSGRAWLANYGSNSVAVLSSSGTALSPPTYGYEGGGFNHPYGIALDGSGDVWVVNSTSSLLTELIGVATPVVTPLSANLTTPYSAPASKP